MFYVSLRKVPDKIIEGIVSLRVLLATPIGNHAYRKAIFAAICILTIVVFGAVIAAIGSSKTIIYASSVNGPSHSGAGTGNPALTPKLLWNYTTGGWVFSSPAVVNGVVYVATDEGTLYALGSPTPSPSPTPTPTTLPTATPTSTTTPTPTPSATAVPATTASGAIVDLLLAGNVTSSQMSNVTIQTNQSASTTTVSFTVTGESGTTGFSNLTIPISAVPYGTTPTIFIDGKPASNQGYTQNNNNYYVWYSTSFSTHEVSIVFVTTSPSSSHTAQSSLPLGVIYGIGAAVAVAVIVVAVLMLRKRGKGKC